MNQIKIVNKTGITNDTEVYFNNNKLEGISKIVIKPITNKTVTAEITFESVNLELLCDNATKEIIDLIPNKDNADGSDFC